MGRRREVWRERPEESGDCYQVKRLEPELYLVSHFPDRETRRACCKLKVRVRDEDRVKAIPDADPHGHAAALARASAENERRHAAKS